MLLFEQTEPAEPSPLLHAMRGLAGFFLPERRPSHLWIRWLFLRSLALIYLSAFVSFLFQIQGLIGPTGILPARNYLRTLAAQTGPIRYWFAPSVFWFGSGRFALDFVCWLGVAAAVVLFFNFWPRAMLAVCFLSFLSIIGVAQDFAGYQSDSMLLGAGFAAFFFAPRGLFPRSDTDPPTPISRFLLLWLWFEIYFESGVAKLASHDPEWRHLTALEQYYQNGPLPTWIGWYAQQMPAAIHMTMAAATLAVELGVAWLFLLPRRFRIVCFWIVTPLQLGIIATANYCFLNYLVLCLGFLLLDDDYLRQSLNGAVVARIQRLPWVQSAGRALRRLPVILPVSSHPAPAGGASAFGAGPLRAGKRVAWHAVAGFLLVWVFYAGLAQMLAMVEPPLILPTAPVTALQPFRIADEFGLFANMTRERYEIEFQGSNDARTWTAYPFAYKPQDPAEPPGIYAPYQPRFDWNLWFASLGGWRQTPWVAVVEMRLLENNSAVLSLFRGNPFRAQPPLYVRAVRWQYWFTDFAQRRRTGMWWRRSLIGLYAPELHRLPEGKFEVEAWPSQ
jgi:hypothetical protein